MRDHLLVSVCSWAALAVSSGACRQAVVRPRAPSKSTVVGVAAPPATLRGLWQYHPATQQSSYVLELRAAVTLEADTLLRLDSVSSHTEVTFAASSAGKTVTGAITAFQVQSRGAATPRGIVLPFPFAGVFSGGGGGQLLLIAPTAAPCVTLALPIVQSLRDLWFQVPDSLRLGTAWADSANYASCRDGIPFNVVSRRRFRVSDVTDRDGHVLLTLMRTSSTALEGTGTQSGESVALAGAGTGELSYLLDVERGKIVSARGTTTLDVTLRNKLRTQVVRQVAEIRISATP